MRGPGQVKRIVGPVKVDGLVAHARQDLAAERVVVCFASQAKGLDEVPLGKAMLLKVVCHPPGEAGQLRSGSEEVSADSF
jgi:hypothetical protein